MEIIKTIDYCNRDYRFFLFSCYYISYIPNRILYLFKTFVIYSENINYIVIDISSFFFFFLNVTSRGLHKNLFYFLLFWNFEIFLEILKYWNIIGILK